MPGARLILSRADDTILLQKRSDFGKWGLIAGSPEEGESLTDTIVREAMEEAGIKIQGPVPFGFSSNPMLEMITYPNEDRCQFFALMYACNKFIGEPSVTDDESTDVQWFDIESLPDNCMPSVEPTIAAFCRWQQTGQFQNMDIGVSHSTKGRTP
jgi:8-oxo-dGTP pyrophosphatase MutT (NUDIX family)